MGSLSGCVHWSAWLALALAWTACSDDGGSNGGKGGSPSSGNGGSVGSGGAPSRGGALALGGAQSNGGTPSHGGAVSLGGTPSSGGAPTAQAGSNEGGASEGGSGGGVDGGSGSSVMTLEEARANYKTFTQRTDGPESISADIFSLCRAPTLPEQNFANSEHGKGLYLLDWLNAGALAGYTRKAGPFDVGSVIVKEKLSSASGGTELAALGIMVKHAPGYDSAHGDWEFGYWESASGMLSGAEEANYCGACHASSSTDFVFLDNSWRNP